VIVIYSVCLVYRQSPARRVRWVHSGSGARYAVDLGGDTPRCDCEDWQGQGDYCKHVWYVLLTDPAALTPSSPTKLTIRATTIGTTAINVTNRADANRLISMAARVPTSSISNRRGAHRYTSLALLGGRWIMNGEIGNAVEIPVNGDDRRVQVSRCSGDEYV
jgi:hypothetical protein